MTLENELEMLIDSLKLFEDLTNRLYAITEGDLVETRYCRIYGNFENVVLNHLIEVFPQDEYFLKQYFTTAVYELATTGTTVISDCRMSSVDEFIDYLKYKKGNMWHEVE